MIIQSAPPGQPHFVIEQSDHARTAGQIAELFGNRQFARPEPAELVAFVAGHHDEGWIPIDALAERSPTTGLPHNLTQTPLSRLILTCKSSPNFNQANHPFCGMLSSMHSYGLFTGRYGLSSFIFLDHVPEESRPSVQAMLDAELARQNRLRAELPAEWAEPAFLLKQYKLLQFFDTLALYFQMTHAGARKRIKFSQVPDANGVDQHLVIRPQTEDIYVLDPWPFSEDDLILTTQGRYVTPQPPGTDFGALLAATPREIQAYRIERSA